MLPRLPPMLFSPPMSSPLLPHSPPPSLLPTLSICLCPFSPTLNFQGKRYGILDFLAVNLMTVGLIFFTLADVSLNPSFDSTGVMLVSLALGADAVIGNVQEKWMKVFGSSSAEMVLYSYSIGSIYLLMGLIYKGIWVFFTSCCSGAKSWSGVIAMML